MCLNCTVNRFIVLLLFTYTKTERDTSIYSIVLRNANSLTTTVSIESSYKQQKRLIKQLIGYQNQIKSFSDDQVTKYMCDCSLHIISLLRLNHFLLLFSPFSLYTSIETKKRFFGRRNITTCTKAENRTAKKVVTLVQRFFIHIFFCHCLFVCVFVFVVHWKHVHTHPRMQRI